ncbi:MAG TPA: SAM-dependent chlorinase/fluorinase [Thermoplasmata archaeon]|nr:SAM-dependent chlorinase/fluorinase [Thermoplasmata archaeon]
MARARRTPPRLVTLASDVGAAYAAQMKAVLARRLPPGLVVDLVHDLAPHDVREAGFLVRAMGQGFPAGTVHLVVVDPGVGGRRAPIAVACRDGSALVGPNNGVLEPLARALGRPRAYRLSPERLPTPAARVGTTFDGRDLFAPAAAAIALGTRPAALGPPIALRALARAEPRRGRGVLRGEIVHVDRFGNLVTNLPSGWAPPPGRSLTVTLGGRRIGRLPVTTHYEALGQGRAGILGSSFGLLEIAVREGRAAERFRARVGLAVTLAATPASRRATSTVNTVPSRRR